MSQPPECLRAGIEALSQERFLEAIDRLESYCYRCSRDEDSQSLSTSQASIHANHFPLAHICLIKAYLGSGDCERALALCQDVAAGSHLMAKHWACYALSCLQQAESMNWHERAALTLPPVPMAMLKEAFELGYAPPDSLPPQELSFAAVDPPLAFTSWLLPTAASS